MGKVKSGINDLKTWCSNNGDFGKQVLEEWTGICVDNNKQYSIDKVAKGSNKRFQWQCSKDTSHIWDVTVNARTNIKTGCPYCFRTKVPDENSLKTWCLNNGTFGQQILKEWTGHCLDDNKQYTPDEVTRASAKRFRWQCSKDTSHIWDAVLVSRTCSKSGCPYCFRTKVPDENSLKAWCSNNGSFGQQLLKEWTGQCIDDDRQYGIDEVAKASGKKFKWQCSKDTSHIWDATVGDRTRYKTGCPYCSGKRITDKNSLKTWCLNNGSFGQQLLNEWTGQCLDDNKKYTPDEVARASTKKFKWHCSKDTSHIWNAKVNDRASRKVDCPYCSGRFGRKVTDKNSLKTWCLNNGTFGQQILKEWTGQCLDDNKQYTPDEVARASAKKFKWRCSKNPSHIWNARVADRTVHKSGCAYCSRLTDKNSLKTWCLSNGDFGQQLLNEWTGQCTDDNMQYSIDEVAKGSAKKFKWQCSKNQSHIWDAIVNARTRYKTGCPYCNSYSTSYPEQVLYHSMRQVYPKTINRGTYLGYEFDIAIPEINTCIEYSGVFWHKDKIDRDNEKSDLCKEHNVNFIQIYAHSGEVMPQDIFESNFIVYKINTLKQDEQLKNIISMILKQFNHSIDDIDFPKACADAFDSSKSPVQDGINDLKTWCSANGSWGQQLLKEWTGQRENGNKTYTPDEVAKASNRKFKWQCSKNPSHIWDATVNDRTRYKTGCPYCFRTKVTDKNSLKTWCINNSDFGKQLLEEWTGQCLDDNKKYTIDEVAKGSNKKFRWRCSKNPSHIWETAVVTRTSRKTGCPYCSGRFRKKDSK